MSVQLFTQQLKEARRDALVSSYIANKLPEDLRDKVKTADDLYEYLLLDTKISEQVKTSPLAESISSLQLAIHRALEGYDGPLDDEAKQYLANEQFLFNWSDYNSRYSTWAGKERLRFYAANYVEPSLRRNKTMIFKELENTLSQGRLTSELAEMALGEYITNYEEYITITPLFIGCGENPPFHIYITGFLGESYYWMEVRLNGDYMPVYWGGWEKLPSAIKSPLDQIVVVSHDAGGVHCEWISEEIVPNDDNGSIKVTVRNRWDLSATGFWVAGKSEDCLLSLDESQLYKSNRYDTIGFSSRVFPMSNTTMKVSMVEYEIFNVGEFENISVVTLSSLKILANKVKNEVSLSLESFGSNFKKMTCIVNGTENEVILGQDLTFEIEDETKFTIKWYTKDAKEAEIPFVYQAKNTNKVLYCGVVLSDLYYDTDNKEFYTESFAQLTNAPYPIPIVPSVIYFALGVLFSYKNSKIIRRLRAQYNKDIGHLLTYKNQESIEGFEFWGGFSLLGRTQKGAFSGPHGQYLWEIFFHIPFLIATRFAAEQRFEEADRWYKYIFNSAGYRDEDGNLLLGNDGNPRYWNTFPLQEDTAWDESLPATTDPDVIATADPMHYKLALFQHTLDLLLARGDAAYRQLERDTLTEAKMYYIEAQQLLGPRPDIRITNTWPSPAPTLSSEAGQIATPSSLTFADWLRAGDAEVVGDGDFRPPYNDVLLDYWDKLDIRLYNLRHNLSLDGQPLSLPLYATPVDPAELHRLQAGGDGTGSNGIQGVAQVQGWRYPLLAERARSAVGMLTQFGNSLQVALERQDNEKMTLLLQTQQQTILTQQRALQQSNLDALQHNLTALQAGRQGASLRRNHYTRLITQRYLPGESTALALRSASRITSLASSSLFTAAGFANMAPNTFGLATGGAQWGAALEASGRIMQITATAEEQSAGISEITANYQRRQEEWQLQRDMADNEIQQLDAQIEGLKEQITMAQKQISLAETEQAHAQAVYDMQTSRFTGQVLYNWLAGRLSALYYQLYDLTLPVCLQAKAALVQELGNSSDTVFRTPVWDDLWQGLLAGEALSVELQKLDNIWLSLAAKGLEATRTVSLAGQRDESSLSDTIATLLKDGKESKVNGVSLKLNDNGGIFSAELDLSTLGLEGSYNMQERARFIKSIAVTLPTLLGPYQDIEATLTLGGEVATLSHGMNDNGRFVTNFDDSRFLPFEGADPTTGKLSLNIFNVKAGDEPSTQYGVVENLSDIIVHIHYILRDKA